MHNNGYAGVLYKYKHKYLYYLILFSKLSKALSLIN